MKQLPDPRQGITLLIADALREAEEITEWVTPQLWVSTALLQFFAEPAIRREVYEELLEQPECSLTVVDVHTIMDGLVSVLWPETKTDPTTEQEYDHGGDR